MSIYIIGEVGSNFDANFNQAKRLIDIAATSGVNAVKFQLFKAELLYPNGPKSVFDSVLKSKLPREWVPELKEYAESVGIDFLASPFDIEAVDLLEKVGVSAYKIASSEVLNHELLLRVAKTKKIIYLSTGMSTMADIAEAVEILDMNDSGEVILLHCSSIYPTKFDEANINLMKVLGTAFNKKTGFSDHTLGINISLAAVALGAVVIEKHFTISRDLEGPDHSYAIEPDELNKLVEGIHQIELAVNGARTKTLLPMERQWGRLEGAYYKEDLDYGEELRLENIEIKRPAIGIQKRFQKIIIGKRVNKKAKNGEPIHWGDLMI